MTKEEWANIKHFKSTEFDAHDLRGHVIPDSGEGMALDLITRLDQIRDIVGEPMIVHSGMRTKSVNAAIGGVDSSAHLDGLAADIEALNSTFRFKLVAAALTVGIRRIGVGNTFVHMDVDASKDQTVIWLYPKNARRDK